MIGYKLTSEQAQQISGQLFNDTTSFNPVQDINGDWFIFEGDTDICDIGNVLKIIKANGDSNCAMIIGKVCDADTDEILRPYPLPGIYEGANFACGVIVKSEIAKRYRFDSSYKIAGDTKFILEMKKSKEHILIVDEILGRFKKDGISSKNYKLTVAEHALSLIETGNIISGLAFFLKRVVKIVIR